LSFSSTISSKGQITVPIEVRRRLGLKQGDRVEFVVDNGHTVLRPARLSENPFEKYVGSLPAFGTVREINEWVAGMRDDNEPK
jgi:AbrB family looped-hinge helix DNA binding protein